MTYKYSYGQIDQTSGHFHSVNAQLSSSQDDLVATVRELEGMFTGEAAEAFKGKFKDFYAAHDAFKTANQNLKQALQNAGGIGGTMHVTDKGNGGKFASIQV